MHLYKFITIATGIFAAVAISAKAEPLLVVIRSLGSIDPKSSESTPGIELYAQAETNRAADVFVVTGSVRLNANVVEHYKWFYDSTSRRLVLMCRTQIAGLANEFRWRIWDEVTPMNFKSGIPFLDDTLRSRGSPYGVAARRFPFSYPENPELVAWP